MPAHYSFPAVRGIQATREYYVTMCPLYLVPKIFLFDEKELSPELRAQRILNKARIPLLTSYVVSNPSSYVFSAITASIDADVEFRPLDPLTHFNIGELRVPMSARFVINDGQHRRAAIEMALQKRPELRDESIACVFFVDLGLQRCQQMFSDLNRYAVRPTKSLNILYDNRDAFAKLVKQMIKKVGVFDGMIEVEKSTISNRSPKLFTLSGVYRATAELLAAHKHEPYASQLELAIEYWTEVAKNIGEWNDLRAGRLTALELRRNFIHGHTVALVSMGRAGAGLLEYYPDCWSERLTLLQRIDWRRSNARQWEGRVMVGGRISISHNNITLLANEIKRVLEIPLTQEERQIEEALNATRG